MERRSASLSLSTALSIEGPISPTSPPERGEASCKAAAAVLPFAILWPAEWS